MGRGTLGGEGGRSWRERENQGGVRKETERVYIRAGAKEKTLDNYKLAERRLQHAVSEESPECQLL